MHVAACFRLVSPLAFNNNNNKNIRNNNNNPKGCLMVMANPLDLGHGKKEKRSKKKKVYMAKC